MLTQLATLKARLGLEAFDPTDDVLLTNIIKHVSARFAAECNRIFDYGIDLTYEFSAEQLNISVDHPPIERVSRFELKTSEGEGWIPQSGMDYLISPHKTLIELKVPLGTMWQLGRATYSGGYILPGATPTGSQMALPDDLEQCCVEQAAYWYQRRTQLGLVSIASEGSVVQQFQTADLLPQVKAVLKHYARW